MADEELESIELQYLRHKALITQVTWSLYPVKFLISTPNSYRNLIKAHHTYLNARISKIGLSIFRLWNRLKILHDE